MSTRRPLPIATIVPLYSGEIVVQIADEAVRMWVPSLGGSPVGAPRSPSYPVPPDPTTMPPPLPVSVPQPDETPKEEYFVPRVDPTEPAALTLPLALESSGTFELAGWVRTRGLARTRELPAFVVSSQRWGRAKPEAYDLAVPMRSLPELVASPYFEPGGTGDLVIHAQGPYVDLSDYAGPLSSARRQGAELVVVVHEPSATGVLRWSHHR
jgi:hypothetical protein